MKHGTLVKKLRLERGVSQTKLSQGICQRSTLASFEQNNSKISFELLLLIMDKLNITMEEYVHLYREENESKKKTEYCRFVKRLSSLRENNEMSMYKQELLASYKETKDFYYYALYAEYVLLGAQVYGQELEEVEQENVKEALKKYLSDIETWGRFELVLFSNCLFIFEDDYIYHQFHYVLKNMKNFSRNVYFSQDVLNFLINGTRLSYERENRHNFQLFLKELTTYVEGTQMIKGKLIVDIFTLLSPQHKEVMIKESHSLKETLRYLGLDFWLHYLERELGKR